MKKGWDRYAVEAKYIKKGYLRKYRNGNPSWKAPEASSCDSILSSKKEEEVKEYSCCSGHQFNAEESTHSLLGGHACPYCPITKLMIPIEKQLYLNIKSTKEDDESRYCDAKRSGRDEEVIGSIMAMQDIPKKQVKRIRKKKCP